jgi:hypothetical protein
METKNYAELSALKWGPEDFDINVERAYNAGQITKKSMKELFLLPDSEKIAVIEDAIEPIEEHLMEQIIAAIFEFITEKI